MRKYDQLLAISYTKLTLWSNERPEDETRAPDTWTRVCPGYSPRGRGAAQNPEVAILNLKGNLRIPSENAFKSARWLVLLRSNI